MRQKPKKSTPRRKVVGERRDGWANSLTAIGTNLDKRGGIGAVVDTSLYVREIQEDTWEADDMFAKIIEKPAMEMMRAGFELTISDSKTDVSDASEGTGKDTSGGDTVTESSGDGSEKKTGNYDAAGPAKPAPAGAKPGAPAAGPAPVIPEPPAPPPGLVQMADQSTRPDEEAVVARWEELHGPERILEALFYEAAYGGAAIFVGANDGQEDLTKPLNLENIKTFQWANVFTPREMQAVRYYGDPSEPKYGEPMVYRIVPDISMNVDMSTSGGKTLKKKGQPIWATREIHESRLIVFPGLSVSKRHRFARNGWGNSVLVRIWQVLQDFHSAYGSAAHLLTDFSQAVIKIKGLADLIFQNDDDVIGKRAQLIDLSRSVARAVILDSEEDFERKSTPVTGLPELLQRFEQRIASAADVPVSVLMGREPSGLGATGEHELAQWHASLAARQNRHLKPRIERFLRLIMLAKDGPTGGVEPEDWSIEFNPLAAPDDTVQAAIRLQQSQVDVAYITAGVLTKEEVASSRFGGSEWSDKTTLDPAAREQAVADHAVAMADHVKLTGGTAPGGAPPAGPGVRGPGKTHKPPKPRLNHFSSRYGR